MTGKGALLGFLLATVGLTIACSDDPIRTSTTATSSASTVTSGATGGAGGEAGGGGGVGGQGGEAGTGSGGEGGSEPPGKVGVVGEPCETPGEKACAGYAQVTKLTCGEDHRWTSTGDCMAGQRCSSAIGPKQGTCQPVLPICMGKASYEVVCVDNLRVRCGADLVTSVVLGECPYQCSNGMCVGACTPLAKQCFGTKTQTCDANGSWQTGPSCPYACSMGQCTGVCAPGSGDCMAKIPLVCGGDGQWLAGEGCAFGCNAGKCTGVCAAGSTRCNANQPETCDPNGAWKAEPPCPIGLPACIAGACSAAPSCIAGAPGAGDTCGPSGNENCCASLPVPGGTFNRIQNPSFPATVSDFRMDRFEITVGRFRQFIAGYPQNLPGEGQGAHSKIAGSGWQTAWNASLPATHAAMIARLNNVGVNSWTDAPGPNESKPLNWLDWYMVFAFCAWDGGRLPTEAEWNYAAAGGSEQRYRPWGTMALDASYAVYDCTADGSLAQDCKLSDLPTVGSRSPKGDGRWGQADLVGSVWEWNLDTFEDPLPKPCVDCVGGGEDPHKSARGGSYGSADNRMNCVFRNLLVPTYDKYSVGGRCARNP